MMYHRPHGLLIAAEYKFPPGLNNHDRAVVHSECKKYGFSSRSHGYAVLHAVCSHLVAHAQCEAGAVRRYSGCQRVCRKDATRQVTVYKQTDRGQAREDPAYNLHFSGQSAMALEDHFQVHLLKISVSECSHSAASR